MLGIRGCECGGRCVEDADRQANTIGPRPLVLRGLGAFLADCDGLQIRTADVGHSATGRLGASGTRHAVVRWG